MDAVNPPLLNAVGPHLLAETGGIAGEGLGQGGLVVDGVDKLTNHGVLRGADEVEVLPLNLVHHVFHLGKAHNPFYHIAANHEGGNIVGETPVDHEVPRVGEDGGMEAGDVPFQVVEAVAGGAPGAVQVDALQLLHNLHVVGHREVRGHWLPKPFHLHIFAVIPADGDRRIDDVGNHHHPLLYFLGVDLFVLLQLRHLVGHSLYLGLGGFRLLFFALGHQTANLLGDNVALIAQLVAPGLGGTEFFVQLDDLIHQGELVLLELLADVLLYNLRIVSYKFHIQHGESAPFYLFFPFFLAKEKRKRKKE